MKDLRNDIVHEYFDEDMKAHFDEMLEYSPKLIEIIKNTIKYSSKYL